MKDDEIMLKLKEILVGDEKKRQEEFQSELKKIENTLYNKNELKTEIDPIIDERIEDLRNQFNQLFGAQVQQQIKDSEEELITALTPLMGKLIQKWIAHEFIEFKSSVNDYITDSTSIPEKIYWKVMGSLFPKWTLVKLLSQAISTAQVIDVFVIQKETGFMMAKYSNEETMNQNQIAGMMTALIDFGQDALKVGVQEKIQEISYELHTLRIYNTHNYYYSILFKKGLDDDSKYVKVVKETVARFIEEIIKPLNFSGEIDTQGLSKKLRNFLRRGEIC